MVDLVKVRKKAKEKKEAEAESAQSKPQPQEQAVEEMAAPLPPSPRPVSKKQAAAAEPQSPPEPVAEPQPRRAGEEQERELAPAGAKLDHFRKTANLRGEAQEARQGEQSVESEIVLELLLFSIAGEQYALPIEKIIEIVPPRRATRVPNAESAIVGIISLRGTIVSILDIRRKLGHPPLQSTGPDSRIIVLENAGETAGFLVDKVSRVVRVTPDRVGSHPVVSMSEQSEYIRGVFQHAERLSILLELETLLRF